MDLWAWSSLSSVSRMVSPLAVVSSSAGGASGTVVAESIFSGSGVAFAASSTRLALPVIRWTASLTLLRKLSCTSSVSSGGGGGHSVEGR